jgi:glutamate synthase domain-containing protein 3
MILGNTVLYGATGGFLFANGRAGERFAVRNSGATAVVEGVGDHGCEYMTNGTVVILGEIGKNFGAGMTGGTAYLYRPDGSPPPINPQLIQAELLPLSGTPDANRLRELIELHAAKTNSPLATSLLADWSNHSGHFWKISPKPIAPLPASPVAPEKSAAEPARA